MATGILTTACGAALGIGIVLAAVMLAMRVRASWRNLRARRLFAEDTDRYIARVRADQQRSRTAIADLRRTAEAYGLHVPPDDDAPTKGA